MGEVGREQEYVTGLYERVDMLREEASARLALALRQDGGSAQSRLERDAAISRYTGQLARLEAAEDGLCFGRLDLLTGECRHIGRIGLRDEAGEGEPLLGLLSWTDPGSAPDTHRMSSSGEAMTSVAHGCSRPHPPVPRLTPEGRRFTG